MKKQPINYNEMILRKLICVVLAFLFVHTINATDSTFLKIEKKDFYEMDSTKITFIKKQEIKLNCKLGNIEKIIDNRENQSFSGVFNQGKKKIFWIEFLPKATLENIFSTPNDGSQNQIIIVIKDLWFFNSKINYTTPRISKDIDDFFCLKLGFKAHIYLHQSNNYYPLKIIDTVLLPQKTDKDHFTWARELLADAIKVTEESIDNCITNSVHTRRKSFSDATFNNIYSKDIYQKLLFDKSTKIGIYKTYADFLNKTPSTDSFNIEFDRFKNVGYHHLFIKESENYLLNRSAWGVYDGNNLWINSNGYLSVLYLRDGLYYWLGIESAEEHSLAFNPNGINQSPIASVGINDNFYWKKAVHFLDTITGKKAW